MILRSKYVGAILIFNVKFYISALVGVIINLNNFIIHVVRVINKINIYKA